MKTLLILRHAKSSWKDPALPDHQRPLNRRGRSAAALMGRVIEQHNLLPDGIVSSTSVRTRQTWELITQDWTTVAHTLWLDELYHCPADGIVSILQQVNLNADRLLLIGHNPGLSDLLARTVGYAERFPTAALAWLTIDIAAWSDFKPNLPVTLQKCWLPRELG